jgi:hypothetical protein
MKWLKSYIKESVSPDHQSGLIVFLHGLESSPTGEKANFLNSNFSNTFIPELRYKEIDPKTLFDTIYNQLVGKNISLIIGSSMGGYLGYCLCKKLGVNGLLFNPALAGNSLGIQFDNSGQLKPHLDIVLGQFDKVVNPQLTIDWLLNNEDSTNYSVFYESIEHRIPIDVFMKHTLKSTSNNMRTLKTYEQFINEAETLETDFSVAKEVGAKKNKWTEIQIPKDPELKDKYEHEFFNLIDSAYKAIGGYAKIKGPDDVFADTTWDVWKGIDIDEDPKFDIIVWGETTPYGIKSCGVGHDGQEASRKGYLQVKADEFKDKGKNYYGEVSDKLAAILINKFGVPVIEDEEKVREVVGKEKVMEFAGQHPDVKSGKATEKDYPGKGWYKRKIGGHEHWKTLVGNPK